MLIAARDGDGSTRIERDWGDLAEVLARDGAALSDRIFYSATRLQGEGDEEGKEATPGGGRVRDRLPPGCYSVRS